MSDKPAIDVQVGGDHYKKMKIQPIEYIHANSIPFPEGCVIKYVSRWREKGGVKDLEKAKHFIELLIELETKEKLTNMSQSKNEFAGNGVAGNRLGVWFETGKWYEWRGGDCPLGPMQPVKVRTTPFPAAIHEGAAGVFNWDKNVNDPRLPVVLEFCVPG